MLREVSQSLSYLLSGGSVTFDQYPALASYFNLNPSHPFALSFQGQRNVKLYCGGNSPLSLAVGGEYMDGLIFGGTFQAVGMTGRLPSMLQIFDDAAAKAGKPRPLPKVAEIKLSVSEDRRAAREFPALSAGTRLLSLRDRGYSEEEIARSGVRIDDMDRLQEARDRGALRDELLPLVTDEMIDAVFVAGDPTYCRERMAAVCKLAEENGFDQLMFSEFGPDPSEGLRLLCNEIIPAL
jgi:alkanesulfonate monooxygenase SsuD/methylene tetrahydromethanopterin reductase-like flavin-dependent oxidoreductase (luciferase family)